MSDRKYSLELISDAEARFRGWTGREETAERYETRRLLQLARSHAGPLSPEATRAFDEADRTAAALGSVRALPQLVEARSAAVVACSVLRGSLLEEKSAPAPPRSPLPRCESLPWPLGRLLLADPF